MVTGVAVIHIEKGFHMRPATIFATAMSKYESNILLITEDKSVNAKSLLSLIGAGIKYCSIVEIQCNGPDENEALNEALDIINNQLTSAYDVDHN